MMDNFFSPLEQPEVSGNLSSKLEQFQTSDNLWVPIQQPAISENLVDEYLEILSPPSETEVKA